MSVHRGRRAAAHRHPQSSLRALDAHMQMLRAEVRTGLSSQDVRRTLIKEKLRQPAPSRFATASAGVGGDIAEIPSAWLEGDLNLESMINDKGGASAASFPAGAHLAGATTSTTSACPAPSSSAPSAALRTYEVLRTAAEEVDYDVSYEEALRHVEERDSETGLATTWRTRCRTSVPQLFSFTAVTASAGSREERGECLMFEGGATAGGSFRPAASSELYTTPPCQSSVAGCSATCRLSAALSASRPVSQASIASAATSSSITATNKAKREAPRSKGGGVGAFPLSTEGTAVVCSSAATYAKTLRKLVQEQRRHASGVGSGPLPSGSTSAAWFGREHNERDGGAAALEWRTRLTAAVTLAVCPSCNAWFERTLQQPQRRRPSEETLKRDVGNAEDASRCCCPRCGHDVGADTPATAAAAGAGPRWAWAPPATTAGCEATPRDFNEAPERVVDPANARCPQQPSSLASSTIHRNTNGVIGETCGTDSVGFAESSSDGSKEESFAALVARIRASRLRAQEGVERSDTMTPSATEVHTQQSPLSNTSIVPPRPPTQLTPTTVPASVGTFHVCSETDMRGEMAPSQPLPLSEPTAPARANPFTQSLRAALSHLYFDDLWASVMGEVS
ncbi:hypothetical protein GH5_06295 [Leishmania sp. Ghana 2012 LV757]|uniref:hypothetical protein n=1 Tax=Leishmania sp. Ghana 2012 LV757 TaxID=2803181 RepID=UPI001B75129F|nr:hypothetical protein GH5_06295 [Leishmania sp. Ghana 2012 LV757]